MTIQQHNPPHPGELIKRKERILIRSMKFLAIKLLSA
jgi:hypothetical protein